MKFSQTLVLGVLMSGVILISRPAAANEQLAASLCDYVAADDKKRLRNKIKDSRIKLRNLFSGITCSGNNLLRHAMVHNANVTGEFIVKKISKSVLAKNGDIEWANSNGHAASPIFALIKQRTGI